MASSDTFTVEGSGEFPLDMLRYDRCWPATQNDAIQINAHMGRRTVTLATGQRSTASYPTVARWESFLWRVQGRSDD